MTAPEPKKLRIAVFNRTFSPTGGGAERYSIALVEQLSFDPWHAIAEHRPLGAIMRARAVAYGPSVIARKAAPEPRSVIQLQRSA